MRVFSDNARKTWKRSKNKGVRYEAHPCGVTEVLMNQAEVAFPAPRSSFYSSSRPSHFVFVEWFRSASRASIASKGVDLRIEELKTQNKQLLEELFALRKACESKDEELTELKEKVL